MELLQLRYFFESSKNENFSKTAEKYKVPSTSVSASVKRLEDELGCRLFDRTANKIILNANGERLQKALISFFSELDEIVENLSGVNEDNREIKMLVRAIRSDITDLIIEYGTKKPHITFKTVFDFNKTDFDDYDIIIDEKKDCYTGYEIFPLYSINLCITASKNNPLSKRKLSLSQLASQPFISMGEHSNMHNILIKACSKAGFSPNIVVQSNDVRCYDKLIASGMGIGLRRENMNLENVSALNVTDFKEKYVIYAYYKKQAAYGNVKNFLNFLKSKAI